MQGPWFDSVDWLPQAQCLGLRDITHVVQVDTYVDVRTLCFPAPLIGIGEVHLFHSIAEAEDWLRQGQARA